MGQERFKSIMLISVESDNLKNLNTELLVKEFAAMAPGRWNLLVLIASWALNFSFIRYSLVASFRASTPFLSCCSS